jgi:hypothetical protein
VRFGIIKNRMKKVLLYEREVTVLDMKQGRDNTASSIVQ